MHEVGEDGAAVYGEGSPLEPMSSGRPVTNFVSARTCTMSETAVPTSSAVMYFPPSVSTKRPMARKSVSVFSVFGLPTMMLLPPPSPVSATADL